MSLTIQIAVLSERIEPPGASKRFRVSPLFDPRTRRFRKKDSLVVENVREDRALENLERLILKILNHENTRMDHSTLIRWGFCPPDLAGSKLRLSIPLRKQTLKGEFYFLTFSGMGRRIVLCPRIPKLSFDLQRGEFLELRAQEVLTTYFRRVEKEKSSKIDESNLVTPGSARLVWLSLTLRGKQVYQKKDSGFRFASINDGGSMDGAQELENVGRCLNRLYPGRLQQAILRDEEVSDLSRHFPLRKATQPAAQPLLMVGQSQVGKTAILHEYLRRHLDERSGKKKREVWLISPQRMISGMCYVGQWEERAHAIFREAAKRQHLLVFDDLIGLFHAGKSASSDLTLGHVLKAYLEEQKLEILAEASPEAIRKLREIDRGFADFFKIIPVREMAAPDTMRVLIRSMQQLENEDRRLRFDAEVLPKVYELQQRFSPARAFPGKAVEMLRQLTRNVSTEAKKVGGLLQEKKKEVTAEDALHFFANKTGLRPQFLVPQTQVDATELDQFFRDRIKGQEAAIRAMCDLVISCTAQVNEPGKPIGSFLFLGPTGVGKTECAKALGEYFFESAERILRFDMNEFVGYDAVSRLIGSPARPGGLLTGAVRRNPFSILLLDEIEKAQPDVFDLLLQLLGDGRLTDAAGQTVDFRNCIVVMTSNLGARDARHQLGFGGGTQNHDEVYRRAAEKFFRPELFNRLDHIVAFHDLGREDIESLVKQMTHRALNRVGLRERQMNLSIDSDIYKRLAELGFQPNYGARALRRSIEEFLIEPLSLKLANLPANQPASVTCSVDGKGELVFRTSNLLAARKNGYVVSPLSLTQGEEVCDAINDFLVRAEEDLEESRDLSNQVEGSTHTIDPDDPDQLRYFSLREDLMTVRRMRDFFSSKLEEERRVTLENKGQRRYTRQPDHAQFLRKYDPNELLDSAYESASPSSFVDRIAGEAERLDHISHLGSQLMYRVNSVQHILQSAREEADLFLIHVEAGSSPLRFQLMRELANWLSNSPYFEMYFQYLNHAGEPSAHCPDAQKEIRTSSEDFWNSAMICAYGHGLMELLEPVRGVHLFVGGNGKIGSVEVSFHKLESGETPGSIYRDVMEAHTRTRDQEPLSLQTQKRAVSIKSHGGRRIHFSSGLVTQGHLKVWDFINPHIKRADEVLDFLHG